jgi:hypothetical protein
MAEERFTLGDWWSTMPDTEDKPLWLGLGEELERSFIESVAPKLGLSVRRNPDKDSDPTAPDLLVNGELADLKCQRTPFFSARRYGKDPGRTVTFNVKDYCRYLQKWPDLWIYFYVKWEVTSYPPGKADIEVQPLHGVWRVRATGVQELVRSGRAPRHSYRRRRDDRRGNARDSYLLSLDDLECVTVFED